MLRGMKGKRLRQVGSLTSMCRYTDAARDGESKRAEKALGGAGEVVVRDERTEETVLENQDARLDAFQREDARCAYRWESRWKIA